MVYVAAEDLVHGYEWNSAERWGGWSWREPSHGEHFRRCSFCGSIHPEDLAAETPGSGVCSVCNEKGWSACFQAQQSPENRHSYDPGGWYAQWADRKYGWPHKFYVDVENRDPTRLFVVSAQNQEPKEHQLGLQWHAWDGLSDAQRERFTNEGWGPRDGREGYKWLGLGRHPNHNAKFYTVHLADASVSDEVKEKIAQVSGLRFTFADGGKVSWALWKPLEAPDGVEA